ncbi:MAG: hypothetical protein WCS35_06155 [Sphaerochaeta sp.]
MHYNDGGVQANKGKTHTELANKEKDALEGMMKLAGLPASLSSFTFPVDKDKATEMYFDADLCYWFLDEGEIRKTLFSSAEEGLIPDVSYIIELEKDFFIVTPIEYSVKGRFSSVEAALLASDYAAIGKEPYEEIDYVKSCQLDRKANDEDVDYISDEGLFDFIERNAYFDGSYVQGEGLDEIKSYDIYEFYNGFFVLDYSEGSVLGKFSSFESAYAGAKEEYGDDGYEDDEE